MKIKKGDQALVTTGKDKGKKGKVIKVLKERALVDGINLKKKRVKPKTSDKKGETVEYPHLISISNLKVICPKCLKASRMQSKIEGKNKKRICKKCKEEL